MELKDLQRNWEELGQKDPLWAILTWPGKKGRKWGVEEFFATGVREVDALIEYLESLGRAPTGGKALDFGCGVGRVTQPLARHFDEVLGVDIARSMIEQARQFNQHGDRCRYRLNESDDLASLADESFDFVYSKLTLQHMPPQLAARFVREFVRVLAQGGLLVFQMAGELKEQRTGGARALRRTLRHFIPEALIKSYRKLRYGHLIDMYAIPRGSVVALLERSGAKVLDVVEDTSAGGGWTSFRYCAIKQRGDDGARERGVAD